jgi:hypothetical protein
VAARSEQEASAYADRLNRHQVARLRAAAIKTAAATGLGVAVLGFIFGAVMSACSAVSSQEWSGLSLAFVLALVFGGIGFAVRLMQELERISARTRR